MTTPHLSRLDHALHALLHERRHAALGTLDAGGRPFVSMVPYAIDAAAPCLVLHVSGLAAHTAHMATDARVSLLVTAADAPDQPVHDLARVTLQALAHAPARGSAAWASARTAYLARFPDAEPMTELPDFRFVTLEPTAARQVAGFGAARAVPADELTRILAA
ncbi:pyridoxamine 5'-phosphate oxidase family protein [Ottowia testudinis]|uniref:Pyridoxamine 5'-phosphate oxidase family protein n=1 Tax=Ottowia testudinis TaxID=2816950 RepID=A0A975CDY4_9BURK|nr:pyridoxamine 5'-phosphate oxidase family protein [Ottowia testudinis]QTD44082.1 pyridoxamine 5'-phosphate oxidase family protein [Ottowia testudinis]